MPKRRTAGAGTGRSRAKLSHPWTGTGERYRPWGISPVSLLEIQFLFEVGRIGIRNPEFTEMITGDQRFLLDEAPLQPLIRHAIELTWTRDPFDRLLAAHSSVRRVPLCTLDSVIRAHHLLLTKELAPPAYS